MINNISNLRKEIDKIDGSIISSIAKRYEIVRKIGKLKKIDNLNIEDLDREKWLSDYHKKISLKFGLKPEVIQNIFSSIIREAKRIQKNDRR